MKGHTDSVNAISHIYHPGGFQLISSTSSDGTLNIWTEGPTKEWTNTQTMKFLPKMMECVAMTCINGKNVLLATGGVDRLIHLFVDSNGSVISSVGQNIIIVM